jgi:uncharacterized protein (DUF58 family)
MSGVETVARRRWGLGSSDAVRVPPSASPAATADKAAVLRRLELEVTRRLEGALSGEHLAVVAGPGSEHAGARPYEPGDEARHIDWSLTARSLAPQVRTTDADHELETWVVADRSASLDFGTALREKREVVLGAVAAFTALSVRAGNRLGLVIAGGEQLRRLPARNGRPQMLASLSMLHDSPRREAGPDPSADLATALHRLHRTQPRRGQVVVVSDFLDTSDWATPLRRLAMRHQVVAVHVTDPRELALPSVGMLHVVDPETGRSLHVQTSSTRLRERYATAAQERHERIRSAIQRSGAQHLHLSTDRDWLLDVVRFARRRRTAHHREMPR